MAASSARLPACNLRWVHRGGPLEDLLRAAPEAAPIGEPGPDGLIARVEAVSICSSDLKVLRMGADHPLLAEAPAASGSDGMVLGHEVCLRVVAVGARQAARFRPGQRLGLQPAMRVNGRRRTIGFDLPGGFAQYLHLGPDALNGHVFEVPDHLAAAEIALLEPYGCVARAYRPNARTALLPEGAALVVLGPGWRRYRAPPLRWRQATLLGAGEGGAPDWIAPGAEPLRRVDSPAALGGARFDDILALGEIGADLLGRLAELLAEGGLMVQARQQALPPVPVDAARIHYGAITLAGTDRPDILEALAPERLRFEVRPGGVALVHGAGGAMGRIHVHRLLRLVPGPATVIATSRSDARITSLAEDFGPMARAMGKRLVVVGADGWAEAVQRLAPRGVDDAVVVVPGPEAVAEAAARLAPDGMLAVFAGFPYGQPVALDLTGVALSGRRFTGSTGCSVADMQDVLARTLTGELDLLANLKAVCGLNHLPEALRAVDRGEVSGKIVVYPQAPDLPLGPVTGRWSAAREAGLTGGGAAGDGQEGGHPCATT